MPRMLLNLAALRSSRSAPLANPTAPGAVSRRQALGLAGAAAVGASPALRLAETPTLGAVTLARGRGRVAFLLGGMERWVIDIRRFSGNPHLTVQETAHRIQVSLTDALYPGTRLSADLTCDIREGLAGWRMDLRMSLGGFHTAVPFERWLAGSTSAGGTARLAATRLALGDGVSLAFGGKTEAGYTPDWRLNLRGQSVATLSGLGSSLIADQLTLALLTPEDPQLLTAGATRRTALTLTRGARDWRLIPDFASVGRLELHTPANAFSSLRIEVGDGRSGALPAALEAESASTDAPIRFTPHNGLVDTTGAPFALALRHALYAVAFEPSGTSAALVARYDDQPVSLHALGVTLELGERAETPPFEMRRALDGTVSVRATPGITRTALPLAGAVVEPSSLAEGAYLSFVGTGLEKLGPGAAARIHLDAAKPNPPVKTGPGNPGIQGVTVTNPSVAVLRPDDLLAVRFEFINLAYENAGDGSVTKLVPVHAGSPSYLSVHFPGQNIAERAFFETVPSYPAPTTPPVAPGAPTPPPDHDQAGGSETPALPVGRALAGESRLVFTLPAGATLPFTLDALLSWEQFPQSVTGTAVPNYATTTAQIAQPTNTQTAIEAPWRLIISPNNYAGWLHSLRPVTHNGRTELWHTRLGVRIPVAAQGSQPARTLILDEHYVYEKQATAEGSGYAVTLDLLVNGDGIDLAQGLRTIRAVWSPDYVKKNQLAENAPFRSSLTGQDRADLVRLTSQFPPPAKIHLQPLLLPKLPTLPALPARRTAPIVKNIQLAPVVVKKAALVDIAALLAPKTYYPLPVQVDRLMLTALGAWMDMRGAWDGSLLNPEIALEEWRHRATMGRDNYVRVVYKGYLFPFGHKASLVKVTERKFYKQNGRNVAYLFQHMFIIVREPLKTFGNTGLRNSTNYSIDSWMPLKQVQITTKTTPFLDIPQPFDSTFDKDFNVQSTDGFWPRVAGQDFQFHLIGQDGEGQKVEFTAPLAFISIENSLAYTEKAIIRVAVTLTPSRSTRPTNGQKVAFAPSQKPGDTTLHTQDISFTAYIPPQHVALPEEQPRFYPIVIQATASIPQVEALLHSGQKPKIKLSDHFLQHGLGGSDNVGEVFAELASAANVAFGQGNSGGTNTPGVVTPNFGINSLSRSHGPAGGDPAKMAKGLLDNSFIKDFFDDSAKILGVVPLFKIIEAAIGDFSSIPKMIQNQLPTQIEATLTWNPALTEFGPFKPTDTADNNKLMITATVIQKLSGGSPTFTILGMLNKFEIDLFEVINISFDSLTFNVGTGKKLSVVPKNVNVLFAGALSFVNDLKDIIPSTGFDDGPYVDIEPDHVAAGFNLEIPSVGVGIFSLENISLGAKLVLSFAGDPVHFFFNFCTKDHPFLLSVSLFGGGGYFGITLGLDGVEEIEAAFEFGANISIDLGIASGGISVMAGIYFKLQKGDASTSPPTPDSTMLTGFVDAHGSVSVLAIASVSIDFHISLNYEKTGQDTKVWGEATFTISISILFFSISFSAHVEKQFSGSHHDPTFADQVSRANWNKYLQAFAA
jgi:hypothetical protein